MQFANREASGLGLDAQVGSQIREYAPERPILFVIAQWPLLAGLFQRRAVTRWRWSRCCGGWCRTCGRRSHQDAAFGIGLFEVALAFNLAAPRIVVGLFGLAV